MEIEGRQYEEAQGEDGKGETRREIWNRPSPLPFEGAQPYGHPDQTFDLQPQKMIKFCCSMCTELLQPCPALQHCGLQPTRLLGLWDPPGENTGVGCHAFLQGIFPTRGSNPSLLHLRYWQAGPLSLVRLGSPSAVLSHPVYQKPWANYTVLYSTLFPNFPVLFLSQFLLPKAVVPCPSDINQLCLPPFHVILQLSLISTTEAQAY